MLIYYLLRKEDKRHCILIEDFNTFMYNYTIHRGRKNFCRYCLQAVTTANLLKCHVNN